MDVVPYINQLSQMTAQNNAWSAEQVSKQMDFQKYMSNTAHQREVADLKAAGLNPILSASSSGASTPSGNAASADNSAVSAISSILGTVLETENAKAIADKNNSAAALRQQASDRAEMNRLVYSAQQNKNLQDARLKIQYDFERQKLKSDEAYRAGALAEQKAYHEASIKNDQDRLDLQRSELEWKMSQLASSGYSGSGSGSSTGSNNVFQDGSKLDNVFEWTDGFINALPDKGNTRLFGVSIPNSWIKYVWNTLGPKAYDFLKSASYSDIASFVSGSGKSNVANSAKSNASDKVAKPEFGGSHGEFKYVSDYQSGTAPYRSALQVKKAIVQGIAKGKVKNKSFDNLSL